MVCQIAIKVWLAATTVCQPCNVIPGLLSCLSFCAYTAAVAHTHVFLATLFALNPVSWMPQLMYASVFCACTVTA